MKIKIIYLLVFLIFVLILVIFFRSVQKPGQVQSPIQQYVPTPNTQTSGFTLISTNIPKQSMGITGEIRLTFSQPVSEKLIFTIKPKIEVRSGLGSSSFEFVIAPKDSWAFDTSYTLTISGSNISQYNQSLNKDFVYTFKTPPYSGI